MRYPAWKYVVILIVLIVSTLYALPNLYPDEPAIQITGAKAGTQIDASVLSQAEAALKAANISSHGDSFDGKTALLRVRTSDEQLKAQDVVRRALGDNFVVALNLAQTTPKWLTSIGATPMKLGLDLRGGVHFLLQVDMTKAIGQRLDTAASDIRRELRADNLNFRTVQVSGTSINVIFDQTADRDAAVSTLRNKFPDFVQRQLATTDGYSITMSYTDAKMQEISQYAVGQNLTTLRNRINELGVAEAVVQTQGSDQIAVDLPGVQDTAEAKRVLGRTANLEFHLVDDGFRTYNGGPTPPGTVAYPFKTPDGQPILLKQQIILTGDRVQNAQAGFDQNGSSSVNITLDTAGGKLLNDVTRNAVNKMMAVLFIESKQRITYGTDPVTGKPTETRTPYTEKTVINYATIQSVLGSNFQITGVGSPQESSELALLLRSGALAAPMYFVEERTVGPSLGQANIDKGMLSTQVGFGLVALFMLVFYRLFGFIADLALFVNLAMILAIMSAIGSALSLPGIAGIVLTIGIAVDANVLICERIREELRHGAKPVTAIVLGYERAFGTIIDAHVTTLLVAIILFAVGSGPIKGFAVTLAIGILCSLFTAITVTRAVVQLIYGGKRRVEKLSI